ncbi:unnamed protein product, partial [Prorocentrum cordatum]
MAGPDSWGYMNLLEEVRGKLSKNVKLEAKQGNVKNSQSMGAIEAPIGCFQEKGRTYKFDLEKRYGMKSTADAPIWRWVTRNLTSATSTCRPRADGGASHQADCGVTYNGEILPCAETALFKETTSHAWQIAAWALEREGESSFVMGVWIGKHTEGDATCSWHQQEAGPAPRNDAKLRKAAAALPWGARSAEPREPRPRMQRPVPAIVLAAAEQTAKQAEAEAVAAPGGINSSGRQSRGRNQQLGAETRDALNRRVEAISLDDPIDCSALGCADVAAYVAASGLGAAVGLKGMREALEVLARYGARRDTPGSESGKFKMIEARWGPQMRGGACKWRYVAQEFKWMEQRGDVFAASFSAQTSRPVDFVGIKEGNHGALIADCVKAYYQADETEMVCVEPPAEYLAILAELGRPTDIAWALEKMLPGQRVAGAGWVDKAAESLTRKRRYSHLKRDMLRLMSGGVMLRPNVKRIEDLIYVMGTGKAKPAKVPSSAEEGPTWSPELGEIETAKYRSGVGISRFISPDRANVRRGVQLLVVGYLKGAKTSGVLLKKPVVGMPGEVKLQVHACADFATRPGVQTASSGEAVSCVATSMVMGGKLIKNALEWLGCKVTWGLSTDSRAAKAMINRDGLDLADIADCSAMEQHEELEACSVTTTTSRARQSLLATLLAQGAIVGSATNCELDIYEKKQTTSLVGSAFRVRRERAGDRDAVRAGGIHDLAWRADGVAQVRGPTRKKSSEMREMVQVKGEGNQVQATDDIKRKKKDGGPTTAEKMSQAPCTCKWMNESPRFVALP